jgi:hypothetical protein
VSPANYQGEVPDEAANPEERRLDRGGAQGRHSAAAQPRPMLQI